jgi:hypothetical protein
MDVLAINLAMAVGGAVWAIRFPASFRVMIVWLSVTLLILVGLEALLGIARLIDVSREASEPLHRWCAHAMVILCWLLAVIAAPARIVLFLKARRIPLGLLEFGASLATLAVLLLASFTGYLASGGNPGQDTIRRFYVLHGALLPTALTASLIVWITCARRLEKPINHAANIRDAAAIEPVETGNPYQSPTSL